MKLIRKSIGRIATTLLATAMLAGVMSTAAFAEGGVTTMTDATFTVETTLTVPANVITPALEITYAVETAQASANETRGDADAALPVYDGVAGGVTATQPAKFNQGTTAQSVETDVNADTEASFTVNLDSFDHAGIYKYKISVSKAEGVNGYEGVTYDATEKYLYVYITNGENGALEVSYVELADVNDDGAAGDKSATFEHKYGVDGDGNDILYDLDLQKIVAGDAANMNESFTFPVTITSQTGTTEKFYAVVGAYDADGAFVPGTVTEVLTSGETATFTLKHNEVVRIYGLSENDEYALYETEGGKNGYTTTAEENGQKVEEFSSVTDGNGDVINEFALNNENADVTEDVRIVYTNTRNVATPTGVLMDVAPYAAMVALAVAGCFVFLRKRDVEE